MVRFHALHDSRRHKPAFLVPPPSQVGPLPYRLYFSEIEFCPVRYIFRLLLVVCARLFPQAPLVVPLQSKRKNKNNPSSSVVVTDGVLQGSRGVYTR
jgi:hypothetical protein